MFSFMLLYAGNNHPYPKKVGNVMYEMLYSSTFDLVLMSGLWCSDPTDQKFISGGMFIRTDVKKLFFEGFTDPAALKYLNLKMMTLGRKISFECVENAYVACGKQSYQCSPAGVKLNLPNGKQFRFTYVNTPHEKYFAPTLTVSSKGGLNE